MLHIRRYPDGTEITSPVLIGDENTLPFYRASEALAMTAITSGADSIYSIIGLETDQLVDEISYKKPQQAVGAATTKLRPALCALRSPWIPLIDPNRRSSGSG